MTRVMVWNIDKFDIHKINQLSLSANPAFGLSEWEVSTGIFGYIIDNLSLTLPDGSRIFPDIFVVIEVSTEFNANNLTPGSGPELRALPQIQTKCRLQPLQPTQVCLLVCYPTGKSPQDCQTQVLRKTSVLRTLSFT